MFLWRIVPDNFGSLFSCFNFTWLIHLFVLVVNNSKWPLKLSRRANSNLFTDLHKCESSWIGDLRRGGEEGSYQMNDIPNIFVLSWQYMYVVFSEVILGIFDKDLGRSANDWLCQDWPRLSKIVPRLSQIVQMIVFVIGLFSNIEAQPRENSWNR